MKYGHFDNQRKEYVITRPDTPYPWINYLGTKDFFTLMSNTNGGYTFYRDARLRRITRYRYNTVPADDGGKYFYINEQGDVWSPGWKPVKSSLDLYECRHGMGYTIIKSTRNHLATELTCFVPVSQNCEVRILRMKNQDTKAKEFKVFSFVEFNLWNALDDMTNFQRNFSTGEVEIEGSAIYHKTEYKERRNHYAFYWVNEKIDGFDTDRESFFGLYNGFDHPDVVFSGQSKNTIAHGWSPIASHQMNIRLDPGEEKELVFVLGYIENPDNEKWETKGIINKIPARAMISGLDSAAKAWMAFDELKAYWDSLLSRYQIKSKDDNLDTMVNTWNQYQCMVTFCMSRSASYFESGIGRGMGFRDSNQDLIGFVHMIPESARERILDIAATQLEDGGAWHQYQPLTKRGNADIGGNFNDDPLWLILSVTSYIKETGDFAILDELVPYNNDESKSASLYDHLRRSFDFTINRKGPHGLPLIGRADWNDCLNLNCFSTTPDEPFQTTENKTEGSKAESLMIAGMFVLFGRYYAELCDRLGKNEEAKRARAEVAKMEQAVIEHGWDGEWYLRAYDFYGEKIGSNENKEGKIFIESQGFCTMAEIGKDRGMVNKALESVKTYLDTPFGIVLNTPAFTEYYLNMGEISTYPKGYKENAGIFCHNNPWVIIGETLAGNGERAFEYYSKIAPSYLQEIQDLHKTEPYVYSQMIAGKDAFKPGEAKNSWLTGTAAWNFYAVSQFILGIRPEYDGLTIDPCVPPALGDFTITRKFRNKTLTIKVKNGDKGCGVKAIRIRDQVVSGNQVPLDLLTDGSEIELELN